MELAAVALHLHAALPRNAVLYGSLLSSLVLAVLLRRQLWVYWKFFYACFLKPVEHGNTADVKALTGQQRALEGFYRTQAEIYDATRGTLLRGREDMLQLAAAQLKHRLGTKEPKPIWVDIGGGTGYNIEKMNAFVPVADFFSAVYLVDLSPSLCEVARQRFAKLGWKNVHVVCEDARTFALGASFDVLELGASGSSKYRVKADFVSMSYSLSMIPDFYSVIDSITDLLAPHGLISCVDFYVQSASSYSLRNFTGGHHSRHVNWFSRLFWRAWFQLDRVHLDEGRRDYLEHRFGTILNVNERNYTLGGIPYYIWLGCQRTATSAGTGTAGALVRETAERIDALATESPYLSPVHYSEKRAEAESAAAREMRMQLRSKGFEAAILNLATNVPLPSFFYQNQRWRLYYDESLRKHTQFGNRYIYAFTWEDPAEDQRLLNIGKDDVVFAITSAGDNILSYALHRPRSIHAVDLNPTQNHLLELKVAAFSALPYEDVWKLFGEGRHPHFRDLLLTKLSPYLSSRAFQFWLDNTTAFTARGGLYETGGTRIAVKLSKWLFRLLGRAGDVRRLCAAKTLREQRAIWRTRLRPVVLSRWLSYLVVANEQFLWRALGVPPNQRDMIYDDGLAVAAASGGVFKPKEAMWRYVVNTLDPVVENTLLRDSNYFYRLCLMGRYSEECRPAYLTKEAHDILSRPGAFDGLRVHTDEFVEVLARIRAESVTVAVIMDHMDWFDPEGTSASEEIRALNKAMKIGGHVLLRSAGLKPWYIASFSAQGFKCERVAARTAGKCIDRVNMYASTWICTKVSVDPTAEVELPSPLNGADVGEDVDFEAVETLEL
ncbi:S-adenosyl-L-methionine-dependent methyltransferase [Trametes coccinea BRFM310]|uniref:S-adenosyl-L-methionine-dependent methyltransferase n=1 Tax=Trametes coccinea (strain BRFM310) TaxID=1353009 RepID=A0A1Y2IVR5_TRAC3|nr:S-adenosyl-L-methionine-dependent methyltransferase [Trametes coccinea BRFM310]